LSIAKQHPHVSLAFGLGALGQRDETRSTPRAAKLVGELVVVGLAAPYASLTRHFERLELLGELGKVADASGQPVELHGDHGLHLPAAAGWRRAVSSAHLQAILRPESCPWLVPRRWGAVGLDPS